MDNQHVKRLLLFAPSECSKLEHFIEFQLFSISLFTAIVVRHICHYL